MTLIDFLLLLLVAGISGAIGQAIGGYKRGGCLVSIAIGFIGALIGTWIARQLALPAVFTLSFGGTNFPIVWAIIGGALLTAVLGFFNRSRRF